MVLFTRFTPKQLSCRFCRGFTLVLRRQIALVSNEISRSFLTVSASPSKCHGALKAPRKAYRLPDKNLNFCPCQQWISVLPLTLLLQTRSITHSDLAAFRLAFLLLECESFFCLMKMQLSLNLDRTIVFLMNYDP